MAMAKPVLSFAQVQSTARLLATSPASLVRRTPVLRSAYLDELCGHRVHLKCECLQHTGSFKIRGATNAVLNLSDEAAERGVVTHSSGNHGAAVAAAAAARGVQAVIVVPHTTPDIKARLSRLLLPVLRLPARCLPACLPQPASGCRRPLRPRGGRHGR